MIALTVMTFFIRWSRCCWQLLESFSFAGVLAWYSMSLKHMNWKLFTESQHFIPRWAAWICWNISLMLWSIWRCYKNVSLSKQLIFYLLPYLQSCTNPIIYCFMSNNFRKSMRNACRTRCHVCTRFAQAVTNSRHCDFDMETKSMNSTSKYSPTSVTNARNGRTMYTSIVSECWHIDLCEFQTMSGLVCLFIILAA